MTAVKQQRLAWLDLEMSGLDVETCYILEIGVVITDYNLQIIDETPSLAIRYGADVLENMNAWCLKTHTENGLIKRSYESNISTLEAEEQVLAFLSKHIKERTTPLCGNCIYQDRKFLDKYMPRLSAYLTHQLLDLATMRIVNKICSVEPNGETYQVQGKHLAIEDIKDHIAEFKYYLKKFSLK